MREAGHPPEEAERQPEHPPPQPLPPQPEPPHVPWRRQNLNAAAKAAAKRMATVQDAAFTCGTPWEPA